MCPSEWPSALCIVRCFLEDGGMTLRFFFPDILHGQFESFVPTKDNGLNFFPLTIIQRELAAKS